MLSVKTDPLDLVRVADNYSQMLRHLICDEVERTARAGQLVDNVMIWDFLDQDDCKISLMFHAPTRYIHVLAKV